MKIRKILISEIILSSLSTIGSWLFFELNNHNSSKEHHNILNNNIK